MMDEANTDEHIHRTGNDNHLQWLDTRIHDNRDVRRIVTKQRTRHAQTKAVTYISHISDTIRRVGNNEQKQSERQDYQYAANV